MTRINACIPVENLTDEHLLAEHREIKRIPTLLFKRITNRKKPIQLEKVFADLPKHFTLGFGHALFFLNKPQYTLKRYLELHFECLERGFEVKNYEKNWDVYDQPKFYRYYKLFIPKKKDKELIITRIEMKIKTSNKKYFHHYSTIITKKEAIKNLNK